MPGNPPATWTSTVTRGACDADERAAVNVWRPASPQHSEAAAMRALGRSAEPKCVAGGARSGLRARRRAPPVARASRASCASTAACVSKSARGTTSSRARPLASSAFTFFSTSFAGLASTALPMRAARSSNALLSKWSIARAFRKRAKCKQTDGKGYRATSVRRVAPKRCRTGLALRRQPRKLR